MFLCFNPHTHAGCDYLQVFQMNIFHVSIHTPTQGVTPLPPFPLRPILLFQSTHPRRVWRYIRTYIILCFRFQSTHPRRVWHWRSCLAAWFRSFNPHTHAGCDMEDIYKGWDLLCFNPHTHAGCDILNRSSLLYRQFQSTHPRRVWLYWPIMR